MMNTRVNYHADGTPRVKQPTESGWDVSYNPDNGRWYIAYPDPEHPGEMIGHRDYSNRGNAVAYARRHPR